MSIPVLLRSTTLKCKQKSIKKYFSLLLNKSTWVHEAPSDKDILIDNFII